MKLGILDQAPVIAGQAPSEALRASVRLAQAGERMGYGRYWLAEHHGLGGLASTTPEVMLGMIGALTSRIRLGAGAILLPYYKPYKVAETFRLLASLYPGRIDLGVARSPGGPAEMSMALSDNYLERALRMPEDFAELLRYLDGEAPVIPGAVPEAKQAEGPSRGMTDDGPAPWVLGTSVKSAGLAAAHGTGYAYGHFMNRDHAQEALAAYRKGFNEARGGEPRVILAVSAVCADTQAKAEEIALGVRAWRLLAGQGKGEAGIPGTEQAARLLAAEGAAPVRAPGEGHALAIGDPAQVRETLARWQEDYDADELMIVSYAHDFDDRLRSYELIMEACSG